MCIRDRYIDVELNTTSELNFYYTATPALSLMSGSYQLLVRIFYQDDTFEYSNLAVNKPLLYKAKTGVSFAGVVLFILLGIGGLYVLSVVVNAVVNRFFYQGKKQQQFDVIESIKSAIRKKE
eukprot:TRINITY_DN5946_c0_g1_i3.p2 TRINITY_DN5946_c0_g1~~TRINITY_DN5946_c0_g1_i3.p2  ORF type:complete len:122 (-),score=33.23 TRINITY_DN5946_c0_g1_i3:131-496(-)